MNNHKGATIYNTKDNIKANANYSGCDIICGILCYNPNTKQNEYQCIGNLQTVSYSVHRGMAPVTTLGRYYPKSFTRGGMLIAGSLVFTVFDRHSLYNFTKGSSAMRRVGPASMLPAFDIIMNMTNEYGFESILIIYGCRIGNEGQVHSVEDIYTENTMSFMAHDINLLEPTSERMTATDEWIEINKHITDKNAIEENFKRYNINYTFDTRKNLYNDQIGGNFYSTYSQYPFLGKTK